MSASNPVVFISAASVDLKKWRDHLDTAFSRAGFRVLTQDRSLRSATGDIRRLLSETVEEADCVIHLAGMGYGSHATDPFPETPTFQCSWTQFEYYHAHHRARDVIAFVCAPGLSQSDFKEKHSSQADLALKERLQQEHRERVASGQFTGTPLDGKVGRTSNEIVDSPEGLLESVAAAVGTLHKLDKQHREKAREELCDFAATLNRMEGKIDDNAAMLKRLVEGQADFARQLQAQGKSLADYTPEEVLVELARRENITPQTLRRLLDEARASGDISVQAQGLMLEQQFKQAAHLSRKAGDAKAKRLHAQRQCLESLAAEASVDYHREGDAHYYQCHFAEAITAYDTAIAHITPSSHLHIWALIQNSLAIALTKHGGSIEPRLGNPLLARAVAGCRSALASGIKQSDPQTWAMTQNNLGLALHSLASRSEREAGMALFDEAIVGYRAALEVYKRENTPQLWAGTQINLGNALRHQSTRRQGTDAQTSLREAATAYRLALEVYTAEGSPEEWAAIQSNLGNVFFELGQRSEGPTDLALLSEAANCYKAALKVQSRSESCRSSPLLLQDWAGTQSNLGIALSEQGKRTRGQAGLALVTDAITAFYEALKIHTRTNLPQQWASTANNLGRALTLKGDMICEIAEKRHSYELAEKILLPTLEVFTEKTVPYYNQKVLRNLHEVQARLKVLE